MAGGEKFLYDLDAYDYDLPEELIAQTPASSREASRLLLLDRQTGRVAHRSFREIGSLLRPGDLLVVNNTRVVPARFFGFKETGGRVEFLVLDPHKPRDAAQTEGHECLLKSSKPVKAGALLHFQDGFHAEVLQAGSNGRVMLRFPEDKPLLEFLAVWGEVPLPPYIKRSPSTRREDDRHWYQTVYAARPGAVAAPTAGLHFSSGLLDELRSAGVEITAVTLHVGYGTFSPIRTPDLRDHRMHTEQVEVPEDAAAAIKAAKGYGRRIVAVGTTVVRVLEWVAAKAGEIRSFSGPCDHYIYPGYDFKVVDALITNFHLPRSSLIVLVSAFAGRENILNAYEAAVARRYRFFSYGDAMIIV